MYPHLFSIPLWIFAALMGAALGSTLADKTTRSALIGAAVGALLGGLIAFNVAAGKNEVAVQGYGVLILIGFIVGVAQAEWRVPQIGVKRFHVLDMGLTGALLGIAGARVFFVFMNWDEFNPFSGGTFQAGRIAKMFYIWEGGLVFYGAFLVAIPWTYIYCKRNKIPAIPFMDVCAPGLIIGQAFGRIGCFMTGCCFGRVCNYPWAVRFPGRAGEAFGSPPFEAQVKLHEINAFAARSAPVHPTQLYASLAGFLTFAFLFTYWPRRKYDGQILALTLIMAGTTRFFEEMLRNDDAPPYPQISEAMTIAQWVAIPIVLTGIGLMLYFRNKNEIMSCPKSEPRPQVSGPV